MSECEYTEHADLNMADDFDRAIWQIREEYADAADIERELRFAKVWADRVEVEYDEGPSAVGFHKADSVYWYLIGDACWDADDPRSEIMAHHVERLSSALAAAERERDEAQMLCRDARIQAMDRGASYQAATAALADQRAENGKLMTLLSEAMKTQEALTKDLDAALAGVGRLNHELLLEARCVASRDGQLEAVKGERNGLHAELKKVVDIAIDECGLPVSAMLGADAPSRALRKLKAERDSARNDRDIVIERLRSTITERDSARAEAEKMRRVVDVARRVASRGMHLRHRSDLAHGGWEMLPNDVEILRTLADAITALAQDEREGKGE